MMHDARQSTDRNTSVISLLILKYNNSTIQIQPRNLAEISSVPRHISAKIES